MSPTFPFTLGPACDNSSGVCVCPPYTTGRSDWLDMEGELCQINYWVILGLWVLFLLCWFISMLASSRKLAQLYERFFSTKKKRIATYNDVPSSLVACVLIYFMSLPLAVSVAFIRIFDLNARVGSTVGITVIWFFVRLFFYSAIAIHQPGLLKKILQAENLTDRTIQAGIFRERMVYFFIGMNGLLVLPVLIDQKNLFVAKICFGLFLGTTILAFLFVAVSVKRIDVKLEKILQQSYESSKSEAVLTLKDKLHQVQTRGFRAVMVQILLYVLWLCCPPLWVAHDYLLPLTWITMVSVGYAFVDGLYVNQSDSAKITSYHRSKTLSKEEGEGSKRDIPRD